MMSVFINFADHLSLIASIIQFMSILSTGMFGALGVMASKRPHGLKRTDKVALWGVLVSALLGVTALTVDIRQRQNASKEEGDRLKDQLTRQNHLLQQLQRGQYGIRDYALKISFTLSADDPVLRPLIKRWDSYLKSPAIQKYDSLGYSPDRKSFIGRRRSERGRVLGISSLYVDRDSDLFPKPFTPEHEVLMPLLFVYLLTPSVPNAALVADDLINPSIAGTPKPNVDLSLVLPLSVVGDPSNKNDNIFVRLTYDISNRLVHVEGSVDKTTAIWDDGSIISLLDLPNRDLALAGLDQGSIVSVDNMTFTANPGSGRIRAGTKEMTKQDLVITRANSKIIVSYHLTPNDFPILIALQSEK